jgi:hypothetical protein
MNFISRVLLFSIFALVGRAGFAQELIDSCIVDVSLAVLDVSKSSNSPTTNSTNYIQKISPVSLPKTISFAGENVPIDRPDVREALQHELTVNTYRHSNTIKILKSIDRWRPFVLAVLKEQNVPEDFIYLAIIESEFDNNARSAVGAMGMWQLMEQTAKELQLPVNEDVDMRRDPKKATEAASKFLKQANGNFNNWINAAASYNVGITGMKSRLQDQKANSFFDLYLNQETARYVYRILALKLIVENPEAYGYFIPKEEKYEPFKFSTVTVTENIPNLVDFAKQNNTTYKELRLLNPWFNNTTTFALKVPKGESYELRIPMK